MNMEKNKKTNLLEFFNFLKPINFKSFDLKEKKDLLIQNHKTLIRSKMFFDVLTLPTFLTILPFILGFSQFINQKYSSDRKNLFFEQNIPGISFPTQKIHWDTFQYIFKNTNLLENLQQNKIIWSDKEIIIESQNEILLNPNNERQLLVYFTSSSNFQKKKIKSKWSKFLLQENNSNFINPFYQNLDELPQKLQNNTLLYKTAQPLNFSSLKHSNNKTTKLISESKKLNEYSLLNKNYFVGYKTPEKLDSFKLAIDQSSEKTSNSWLEKKQQLFFQNKEILITEFKKLFISDSVVPSFPITKTFSDVFQNKLKNYLEFVTSNNLKILIKDIDQIRLPKSIEATRLMSGYQNPDMTVSEVIALIIREFSTKNSNIKILLPSSFLVPQHTKFISLPPPAILINSNKLILTDDSQREILYEGPGLVMAKQLGLDWETKSKNGSNFVMRSWVEHYLGSKNPTTDTLKNFFGIFESPEYRKSNVNKNSSNKNYWLDNLSIFQTGLIANPTTNLLPFNRSFQFPAISTPEWKQFLLLNSNSNELNSLQLNTILLPIFEARIPTSNKPDLCFSYKNALDFDFIQPFNLANAKNQLSEINFRVPGSNFSNSLSFPIQFTSGIYHKTPSLFSKDSQVFFADIWEPLTFQSWLVSAQIGFAFLTFQILKALADNYGRELLVYLLDLVALLGFLDDDLKQEIEILMGQREKGFRIISKTTKNFNNIGGIQNILPEIVEIVWFLRNSGREFSISKTLPRGFLLTGPPGTGKTLLVQGIAGEAEVPVLALSGSSLLEPGESGALKLEILFQEARKIAPCIVFIDEMDTLAQKRDQVLQNPMGADEVLESLSNIKPLTTLTAPNFESSRISNSEEINDTIFAQQDMQKEKLRILMQFLVELDGIQGRDGVIVIGATNRPEMLDPAILRPGRFDKILDLGLPGPEKRREILKLYSENLGIDQSISWNYLIHRTAGYSAADLAGIMNQSTLNAILKNTKHTIETIEYGIDRITTIGIEKPSSITNSTNHNFLAVQVAYYQAGKILLSALLEHHPPTLVTHLWPRRTNVRALKINENLQKYFFRFARRIELEHRIIGCYAGKAAEILFLQDRFHSNHLSDLGTEDIQFAQNLIHHMIENWYFYQKTIVTQKNATILENFNEKEYSTIPDKLAFFNSFQEQNELSLINKGEQFGNNFYSTNSGIETSLEQEAQQYFPTASWQYQISNEFELSTRVFSDWYRLYLPDPQQTERNLEWAPPDEFYHANSFNQNLTQSINWNESSSIEIDYETHSLIIESFNKALILLDQHREVLDKLASELLAKEILREPEIEKILKDFNITLIHTDRINTEITKRKNPTPTLDLNQTWGSNSRQTKSQNIDFATILNKRNDSTK